MRDPLVIPRAPLVVLAAYSGAVALAIVPAAVGPVGVAPRVIAVLHLALLAALLAAFARRGRPWGGAWMALEDWLPLLAVPLLYAELPMVIATLGSSYHDVLIQGWDQAVFGGEPARTLAAALPWRAVSELLHAAYVSYYPMIYLPPLAMYLTGNRGTFQEMVLALTLAFVACFATAALFPVEGPRYEWAAPAGVPSGPFRGMALGLLQAGSSRGAAFPSAHMAATIAQALAIFRWRARPGDAALLLSALLGVGAVYGGFHYATDIVVGAAVGLASWVVARAWVGSAAIGAT